MFARGTGLLGALCVIGALGGYASTSWADPCGPGTCDDADPCTVDECDLNLGVCVYEPVNCSDNHFCTTDWCSAGLCFSTEGTSQECETACDSVRTPECNLSWPETVPGPREAVLSTLLFQQIEAFRLEDGRAGVGYLGKNSNGSTYPNLLLMGANTPPDGDDIYWEPPVGTFLNNNYGTDHRIAVAPVGNGNFIAAADVLAAQDSYSWGLNQLRCGLMSYDLDCHFTYSPSMSDRAMQALLFQPSGSNSYSAQPIPLPTGYAFAGPRVTDFGANTLRCSSDPDLAADLTGGDGNVVLAYFNVEWQDPCSSLVDRCAIVADPCLAPHPERIEARLLRPGSGGYEASATRTIVYSHARIPLTCGSGGASYTVGDGSFIRPPHVAALGQRRTPGEESQDSRFVVAWEQAPDLYPRPGFETPRIRFVVLRVHDGVLEYDPATAPAGCDPSLLDASTLPESGAFEPCVHDAGSFAFYGSTKWTPMTVTGLSDGGFVIAWWSYDYYSPEMRVRVYDATPQNGPTAAWNGVPNDRISSTSGEQLNDLSSISSVDENGLDVFKLGWQLTRNQPLRTVTYRRDPQASPPWVQITENTILAATAPVIPTGVSLANGYCCDEEYVVAYRRNICPPGTSCMDALHVKTVANSW